MKQTDPASRLVEKIVQDADASNVGHLAQQIIDVLRNHEIDDVFAALALVMVDVVLHYDTSLDVTFKSFQLLVAENIKQLVPGTKETLQ